MSNTIEIIELVEEEMEFEESDKDGNCGPTTTTTTPTIEANTSVKSQSVNFNPNEGRHPLLQPLILMNVFKHIKQEDNNPDHFSTRYFFYRTFLNCRSVCKTWRDVLLDSDTPLSLGFESPEQIRGFLELMGSSPYSQLPCRQISLYRGIYGDHPFVTKFMETFGTSLWRINIKGSFIGTLSFLFLPCWCPNLKYLEYCPHKTFSHGISQNSDYNNAVPTPLKDAWIKPFRKLNSLTITHSFIYPKDETDFIMFLLDKIPSLKTLIAINIKEQTWNLLSLEFVQRPDITKQLRCLHLTLFPTQVEFLGRVPLNLRELNVDSIGRGVTPGAFSKLLEQVSGTLNKLVIRDWNFMTDIYGSSSSNERNFQIEFPCVMPELEDINVKCFKSQIYIGPSEVMRLLPKLKFCNFTCREYLEKREDLEFFSKFWKKFLPPPQYSQLDREDLLVHGKLRVLEVDWCIKSCSYIKEIASCLPGLKKLSVVVKGKLLPCFVTELKDSKVEDLSLTYLKSRGGVCTLTSGLTGIPQDKCEQLMMGQEYRDTEFVQKNFKVGHSLADWKELRKLKLRYKASLSSKDARVSKELDHVAVWNCLSLLQKLETLAIPNFIIQERSLHRIVESVPLKEMNLRCVDVRDNNENKRLGGFYLRCIFSHVKIFGDLGWGFV